MDEPEGRDRFRRLPEPVRPSDTIETVDTAARRPEEQSEVRDRMLREAGAG